MEIPSGVDPIWGRILTGNAKPQFEFLATKLLLRHLTAQVKGDSSLHTLQRCAQEFRNIFVRNSSLACVQRDLKQIIGAVATGGCMHDSAEVSRRIAAGKKMVLAGDENLLKQLPSGDWIGGSIPYFMAEQGGLTSRDVIFVNELPDFVTIQSVKVYDSSTLKNVYMDAAQNGFSFIIIPASSGTHLQFALNAPRYEGFATHPLIGWIAGVHLDDIGKITPKVFDGRNRQVVEDGAVVMHVELPATQVAEIGILNIFEPGDGDTITFIENGFSAQDVLINGVKTNFADYVEEKKLDTRLPLVSDYYGAMVNVSFQSVDKSKRVVNFYAPVFEGITYKHARPVEDYVQQFTSQIPTQQAEQIVFSCNCILNYLYSKLEGKKVGGITGPVTFGEVAYQLLNQTMVYLTITNVTG